MKWKMQSRFYNSAKKIKMAPVKCLIGVDIRFNSFYQIKVKALMALIYAFLFID